MPEHPRIGPWILFAALALGALGDLLFWPGAAGINVALWLAAAALAAFAVVRGLKLAQPRERLKLAAPALLFAALIAWRDAPALRLLDFMAIAVALSLPMWRPAAGAAWRASVGEAGAGVVVCGLEAFGGPVRLLTQDVPWSRLRGSEWLPKIAAVGRGLAVATVPLVIFGSLFMMADAGFEASVTGLFNLDPFDAFLHFYLLGWCTWLAAGVLRGTLSDRLQVPALVPVNPPDRWKLGAVEITIALGLVDLLFAAFVGHQAMWLFGGQAVVIETAGLTSAEYARRGFFELAIVSALVLPMLLAFRWAMGATVTSVQNRLYTALSAALLALLALVIASAAHRMALYQASFGLTELRVFVLAFEAWMIGLLAWFGASVLRGRAERFAAGAVCWGFVGIVGLHVPNLEAEIVRSNVDTLRTVSLDVCYLNTLSDDAVPALAAALPRLRPGLRQAVEERLARAAEQELDWRNANLSRWLAKRAAIEYLHVATPATRAARVQSPHGRNSRADLRRQDS